MLTDLKAVKVQTHPRVADHNLLLAEVPLAVPGETAAEREVWRWKRAKWVELKAELAETFQFSFCKQELQQGTAETAVQDFSEKLLSTAKTWVPKGKVKHTGGSHPWVNDRVLQLVAERRAAENTASENATVQACSQGMLQEFFTSQ